MQAGLLLGVVIVDDPYCPPLHLVKHRDVRGAALPNARQEYSNDEQTWSLYNSSRPLAVKEPGDLLEGGQLSCRCSGEREMWVLKVSLLT